MKRMLAGVVAAGLLSTTTGFVGAEDQIQVGGTGGMTPVMQDLAKAYLVKSPGDRIEVLPPGLGSSGAIKAVTAGS